MVVLVAISGSVVAAGRAAWMVRAMAVALGTQLLFTAVHLIDGHFTAVIDIFFASLWYLSSHLFARAAKETAAA